MIPIRDDNPRLLTPYVTYFIIALNVGTWVLLQGIGFEPRLSSSICVFGAVPGELLQKVPAGSAFQLTSQTLCVTGPEAMWRTLVTYCFLHGGWVHLIGNMWFLWVFGNKVEDAMGSLRFSAFYLLCAGSAALCQVVASPNSLAPIIGASGAAAGVLSAYIVLYPRVHVHMLIFLGVYIKTWAVPAFWMIGYWLILQLLATLSSVTGGGNGVAFFAHVGGFASGALLILLFRNPELLARHPYHGWHQQGTPSRSWQQVDR